MNIEVKPDPVNINIVVVGIEARRVNGRAIVDVRCMPRMGETFIIYIDRGEIVECLVTNVTHYFNQDPVTIDIEITPKITLLERQS